VQAKVLDSIPVQFSVDALRARLHIREGSAQDDELAALLRDAAAVARPKAAVGIAYVTDRGEDYVVVDDVRFDSRVLAVNLAGVHRVFPYVATCGVEIDAWAASLDDILHSYWSEAIREQALAAAHQALIEALDSAYKPGPCARMNPGSLPDWPLTQQAPLFRLMGDPQASIGVTLTESMLMVPSKSVSGIRFPTTSNYENCMLCPREACPGRRAPFDAGKYEREYAR
jgi:hypothetical protein